MKKYFQFIGAITLFVCIGLLTSCEPEPNDPNNPNPTDSVNFALNTFTMVSMSGGDDIAESARQIVVANDNSFVLSTIQGDIYRSVDNGDSWSLVLSTSGTVALGYNMAKAPDGKIYAAFAGAGLYVSTNNGGSFTLLSAGGLTIPANQSGISISVSPTGVILGYLFYGSGNDVLVRSTDGGNNFTMLSLPPTGNLMHGISGPYIKYAPNGSAFIVTESGLYRSDDNGDSWNLKWSGQLYTFYVSSSGHVFFTSGLNQYRSSDNAESYSTTTYGAWTTSEMPNGNLLGVKSSTANEYVYRSTDDGQSWLSMGNQDIYPDVVACNNSQIIAFQQKRQISLDLNETFWRCKKLPNYPAWKDFDVSGNEIVIAANQQLYYSDNLGEDWRIGLFTPWNVYSLDLNTEIDRLAVGCGGSSTNGLYYILDGQASAVLQENYIGISGDVNDIVMADNNSLAFALADPVFTSGSVILVDNYYNGNGTYIQYSTGSSDNLPYRLFYDKYAEKMYITWQGGGFGTSGATRTFYNPAGTNSYFLNPDISYTDWIPVENGYNPGSTPFNFTRSERPDKLFFVMHGPNTLWYQDATHLWKSTSIDLPEQVMQMGFDGNGYFWALINGGLYKSDAVPAIIDL